MGQEMHPSTLAMAGLTEGAAAGRGGEENTSRNKEQAKGNQILAETSPASPDQEFVAIFFTASPWSLEERSGCLHASSL